MKRKIDVPAAIILIVAAAFLAASMTYLHMSRRYSKMDEAMAVIERYYVGDYSREALEDGAVAGMVDALEDRWSYYLSPETLQSYLQDLNNEYQAIGITVQSSEEGTRIMEVLEDSPAQRAGLQVGMWVTAVDGTDLSGKDSSEVKAMVQSSLQDGSVELDTRTEEGETAHFTVEGETIEVDPVRFELLENGVGYIRLSDFDSRSGAGLIEACEELQKQGALGLVFDLRFNPGGLLDELLAALDYLLPEGVLFISEVKGGTPVQELSDAACLEMPMAVLVNEESYSAAEFFAAALQEYEWATVVGAQTSGKGYAQITERLSDGSAIHISAKKYYTPSGVSLANVGVTPDVAVELPEEKMADLYYGTLPVEEDPQLQAALEAVLASAQIGE